MRRLTLMILLCACSTERSRVPSACDVVAAEVGNLPADLHAWAQGEVVAARQDGDAGHHLMADQALDCLASRGALEPSALRTRAHLHLQAHRFTEAEAVARGLVGSQDQWQDRMLLSDALMEQGRFSEAADQLDVAMGRKHALVLLDRAAWLSWSLGDLDHALALQKQALRAGNPEDPEPLAWSLSQMGVYLSLKGDGEAGQAFDAALALVPGYKPALLGRGRLRMHEGHAGAADDLRAAGDTIAARAALFEVDPTTDVDAVAHTDPRGHAAWLLDRDPARALSILELELADRRDPLTLALHARALQLTGADGAESAREALASGTSEPQVLWLAAVVLSDGELLARAKSFGPGLTPSQHRLELP